MNAMHVHEWCGYLPKMYLAALRYIYSWESLDVCLGIKGPKLIQNSEVNNV
jgi:hypothetical protein